MNSKKYHFLFLTLFLLFTILSCSKEKDLSGIYVHRKGIKKYFTLTIKSDKKNNLHFATLEGVSLDYLKDLPWSVSCKGKLSWDTIDCNSFSLKFDNNSEIINVEYESGEKQEFISDKKSIIEEITIYDEKK